MSEKPVRDRPRRLADWLNPTGDKKVHSLVDKVYKRWNLEDAWLRVKSNGGAGGIDGQTLADFEPVFDDAGFGYHGGRSTKDAMRKIRKELGTGAEWIIDADLKDFFGSVDHEKLLTLVAQRNSDGRVLRLIERMLKAGVLSEGHGLAVVIAPAKSPGSRCIDCWSDIRSRRRSSSTRFTVEQRRIETRSRVR
jgi:hypothetical protein